MVVNKAEEEGGPDDSTQGNPHINLGEILCTEQEGRVAMASSGKRSGKKRFPPTPKKLRSKEPHEIRRKKVDL